MSQTTKYLPKLPRPNYVSGPEDRNFNLTSWTLTAAPQNESELSAMDAADLHAALTKYLEYINKDNWAKVYVD